LLVGVESAVATAKTVLNLNSQWPATTVGSQVDQWFADEIKRRTNGEVEIKIFWSESLGTPTETLTLMQEGAIDMAVLSPGYFPAELPFHAAPNSIPMAMTSVTQASVLMKRLVEEVPAFREEQQANGIRSLFFHHLNPYLLVSTEPITTIADMKGKKMRTWGNEMPRMVRAVGGTPITLMMPEIYESLSRGLIDTAPFAVDLVETYKLYEPAKHISEITLWLGPSAATWISDQAWSRLTPEQQKIFLGVAEEARARDAEAVMEAATLARGSLQAKGITFHNFPKSEAEKWREANPDFFADFVATMEKDGKGDDAQEMVDIWHEVVSSVH
jgi:TRAP-type C4-dicarboxylate transport system substrate-binding protein